MNSKRPDLVWKIIPSSTPFIIKDCSTCGERRRFGSSDNFRVNAQKSALDIWLIYKCEKCDSTWNCRILSRVHPSSVSRELFDAFQLNDKSKAWDYAFDASLLKGNGIEIDRDVDFTIQGPTPDSLSSLQDEINILVECNYNWRWRIDSILEKRFPISRSKAKRLFEAGGVYVTPKTKSLSTGVTTPVMISVSLGQFAASSGESR